MEKLGGIKMSEIKVKLREIILEIARMEIVEDSEKLFANPNCDLMSDFGLDSLLMVQLIVEIERVFDIEFSLEDLDINILRKYFELEKYIEQKKDDKYGC